MYLSHNCRACVLVLISISVLINPNNSQPSFIGIYCHDPSDSANYADFQSNLTSLLDSLSSKATLYSFYNDSISSSLYGLFLCRGDVTIDICQNCTRTASQEIKTGCASNTSAIIWYDQCMLRYSENNFFGKAQTIPAVYVGNADNYTSPDQPDIDAQALIYPLIRAAKNTDMLFKMDSLGEDDPRNRYGMVQCTRDMNGNTCSECLSKLMKQSDEFRGQRVGWRILGSSCNIRYENYMFYDYQNLAPQAENPVQPTPVSDVDPPVIPPTPVPDVDPPVIPPGPGGNKSTIIILATVLPVAVVASLFGFGYYICFRRKRRLGGEETSDEIVLIPSREQGINATDEDNDEVHYFNLSTIKIATNYFSDENKLGEGGFGPVFKGKLVNGKDVAVKRLSYKSKQGLEEFKNEVTLIAKVQHRNLVKLLGCCLEENEKLLVYEYMANTSLDAFLFDPTKRKELDWPKRAKIINGIARGLLYLHEDSRLKIIHRDLKASNVLLDEEMNPKISDFGTARIFGGNQIEANTDKVVGTYGYMAPEYALEGFFSIKSDVYSYGVLMIESLSGKKNNGFYHPDRPQSQSQNLLSYAWRLWSEGKGLELVEPDLVHSCPTDEALRWIHIGLLCVQDDPNYRPTMSSVVLMLGSNINLPRPFAPPFSVARYFASDQSTSTGQSASTVQDV